MVFLEFLENNTKIAVIKKDRKWEKTPLLMVLLGLVLVHDTRNGYSTIFYNGHIFDLPHLRFAFPHHVF